MPPPAQFRTQVPKFMPHRVLSVIGSIWVRFTTLGLPIQDQLKVDLVSIPHPKAPRTHVLGWLGSKTLLCRAILKLRVIRTHVQTAWAHRDDIL